MPAPARALAQRLGQRVQVDDRAVRLQPLAVRGPDHDTAAGGEHDVRHARRARRAPPPRDRESSPRLRSRRSSGSSRRACARARRRRRRTSCRGGARAGGRAWTCPRRAVPPETDCPDANAPGHCSGIGSCRTSRRPGVRRHLTALTVSLTTRGVRKIRSSVLLAAARRRLEQVAEQRDVAEERHLVDGVGDRSLRRCRR